jgi:hypothetical protein
MGRSRKKRTQTDIPLFYEAMTQFSGENPLAESELQATVDSLKAKGRMPSSGANCRIRLIESACRSDRTGGGIGPSSSRYPDRVRTLESQ